MCQLDNFRYCFFTVLYLHKIYFILSIRPLFFCKISKVLRSNISHKCTGFIFFRMMIFESTFFLYILYVMTYPWFQVELLSLGFPMTSTPHSLSWLVILACIVMKLLFTDFSLLLTILFIKHSIYPLFAVFYSYGYISSHFLKSLLSAVLSLLFRYT